MFSRSPFDSASPAEAGQPVPFFQSRAMGALVLLIAVIVILLFAVGMDTSTIIPANNSSLQATLQSNSPQLPPGHPIIRPGGRTLPPTRPARIPDKLV